MGYAEPRPWTLDEFLAWERAQPERYEYVDGVIRMMTGGTNDHCRIVGNLFRAIANRLEGMPCDAFVEGPKIVSRQQSLYPDVAVICGPVPPSDDFVTDATLIAEVLSASTEAYDRTAKWATYQHLASLQYYLMVSKDDCMVDIQIREADGWRPVRYRGLDLCLDLPALGIALPMLDIYRGTAAARR